MIGELVHLHKGFAVLRCDAITGNASRSIEIGSYFMHGNTLHDVARKVFFFFFTPTSSDDAMERQKNPHCVTPDATMASPEVTARAIVSVPLTMCAFLPCASRLLCLVPAQLQLPLISVPGILL